jgi:methylglutaconyl-CoA hydratase
MGVMTDPSSRQVPDAAVPTVPDSPVIATVDRGVATLTLNQPERKNSLGSELVDALADALDAAIDDDAVRVIVLTNVGNTFCAGADLKADAPGVAGNAGRTFVDVFELILASPKPVIGRIDGHATGGGVGLAAVCDISIMRDDAKIGFTEVRLGVAPAVISVVCLPKMRRADASELFLTGERITPARAASVGLINEAVPAGEIDRRVEHYVSMIVQGGPKALAAAKDLIARVPAMDVAEAFEWTGRRSRELFESAEAQAGIAAFRERRAAPWVPAER